MLIVLAAELEPTFTDVEVAVIPPVPALRVRLEAPFVLPMVITLEPAPLAAVAMLRVAVPVVTVLAIFTVSELPAPAAPILIGVPPLHPDDCPKLGQEVVGLKGSTHVRALVEEALSI